MRVAAALQRVLTTAWVGGVWAVGFLVAPILFTVHTRADAGRVAGAIFARLHLVGLIIGLVLIAFIFYERRRQAVRARRFWVLATMTVLTAINHFGVAAAMQALRGVDGLVVPTAATEFARLHGVSSALFLVVAVLGLGLIAARPADEKTVP